MPPAQPAPFTRAAEARLARVGAAAFLLLGWSVLLIPSMIRQIQAHHGASDGDMGFAYLAESTFWVAGTLALGWLAGRGLRRPTLTAGPSLMALGLAMCAVAPAWPVFVVGYVTYGFGAGIIDAGVNALVLDAFPRRRAAALNRLHLWVAVGALASPVAVGQLIAAGVAWEAILLGTAAVGAMVAVAMATQPMPAAAGRSAETGRGRVAPLRGMMAVPLALLAGAVACYIALEFGVSNWLVRFLGDADLEVATLALSLFWAGLAAGRLIASWIGDRIPALVLAAGAAAVCGIAVVLGSLIPSLPVRLALFALAGVAAGPIYPMIIALGGARYPDRTNLVSSVLGAAGVTGSIVYPPLMGFASEAVGLTAGMVGAGLLCMLTGVLIVAAEAVGERVRPRATPVPAQG